MQKRIGTVSRGVLFVLIVAGAGPAVAVEAGHASSCGELTIRVWNTLPAEAEVVLASKPVLERIFRRAGVNVRWIDCSLDDPICPWPKRPTEVSLRIYRRPEAVRRETGRRAGGAALTGVAGAGIVHIHYERLEELGARGAVALDLSVGVIAAHEIGHLLLARGHSLVGIMRPTFEDTEWQLARDRSLVFTSHESQQLRQALCRAARNGQSVLQTRGPIHHQPR